MAVRGEADFYFCSNDSHSLKRTIPILLLWALPLACRFSSQGKKNADDSLQYYPPTPAKLERSAFREYYRAISTFFDSTLLRGSFNGQILIAKDGEILYERYVGKRDLRKKDTMSASTSLHVASTSKTFTGTAILRLVQEQKLSLDDSLSKFFPGIPYPGITIRMMLNHRSGLPNYIHFADPKPWKHRFMTNTDVLNLLYTQQPQRSFPPDTHFSYSNTNFVLLALIIEKITGESFPDHMKHTFFDPLDMKDTYVFSLKDTLTANPSFTPEGRLWDYDFLEGTYGDKNVYTTARDLLKWDQAFYTDQLLDQALQDSAFQPYSFEKKSVHNYGLGWRLQLLPNGKKVIYHFGKWHGSNAAFARLTDEKATIIIIGNRFNRMIYNTAHLCYDIFGAYGQRRDTSPDDNDSPEESVKKARRLQNPKRSAAKSSVFSGFFINFRVQSFLHEDPDS